MFRRFHSKWMQRIEKIKLILIFRTSFDHLLSLYIPRRWHLVKVLAVLCQCVFVWMAKQTRLHSLIRCAAVQHCWKLHDFGGRRAFERLKLPPTPIVFNEAAACTLTQITYYAHDAHNQRSIVCCGAKMLGQSNSIMVNCARLVARDLLLQLLIISTSRTIWCAFVHDGKRHIDNVGAQQSEMAL